MLEAVGLVNNEKTFLMPAVCTHGLFPLVNISGPLPPTVKVSLLLAIIFNSWPIQFNDFFRVYKPGL